jgi:hypothetical protein
MSDLAFSSHLYASIEIGLIESGYRRGPLEMSCAVVRRDCELRTYGEDDLPDLLRFMFAPQGFRGPERCHSSDLRFDLVLGDQGYERVQPL